MNFFVFYMNFYAVFCRSFLHCLFHMNFFSLFATNRLPYILHCFAFVYELFHEFWMMYPWNNESDCITCIIQIFDAKSILQCLWLSSFSQLVLSLSLRLFTVKLFSYCHQLLSYVFSLSNSSVQQQKFVGEVPWNSASCSFICTCNIKTPFCCFADLPLLCCLC